MTKANANSRQGGGQSNGRTSSNGRSAKVLETVESNPLAVLAGGVAVGLAAGLAIPRLEKEKEVLAPLGRKLAESATAAAQAAKDAGRAEIDNLLPDSNSTKERVSQILGNVVGAAKDANKK